MPDGPYKLYKAPEKTPALTYGKYLDRRFHVLCMIQSGDDGAEELLVQA